jgi:hypothetical protein
MLLQSVWFCNSGAISTSSISDVYFIQCSGCIGSLSKCKSRSDSKLQASLRKKSHHSPVGKRRRCSSGLEAMENNASISVSLEGNISSLPNSIANDSKMSVENGKDTSFINHGMVYFYPRLLDVINYSMVWFVSLVTWVSMFSRFYVY